MYMCVDHLQSRQIQWPVRTQAVVMAMERRIVINTEWNSFLEDKLGGGGGGGREREVNIEMKLTHTLYSMP